MKDAWFYWRWWAPISLLMACGSAKLSSDIRPQSVRPPELGIGKTTRPITIDGELTEPDWTNAAATEAFVNIRDGGDVSFDTVVRMLWNDTHIYFAFEVQDTSLTSEFEHHDDHLWEGDCIDIMIDPDGDGSNYFEMLIAPTGRVSDSRFQTRRSPEPFGVVEWSSAIQAKAQTLGRLNDGEADVGYTLEIALPFDSFDLPEAPLDAPRAGNSWHMNFYVIDEMENGDQQVAGWAPTGVSDFHVPSKFRRVHFLDTVPMP